MRGRFLSQSRWPITDSVGVPASRRNPQMLTEQTIAFYCMVAQSGGFGDSGRNRSPHAENPELAGIALSGRWTRRAIGHSGFLRSAAELGGNRAGCPFVRNSLLPPGNGYGGLEARGGGGCVDRPKPVIHGIRSYGNRGRDFCSRLCAMAWMPWQVTRRCWRFVVTLHEIGRAPA